MQPGENTPTLLPAENQPGFTAFSKQTAKETVAEYFAVQYRGYAALRDVDIAPLLDSSAPTNRNLTVWLRLLTMRRALLTDMGLCFVDTKVHPYEIVYDPEPEDDAAWPFGAGAHRLKPTPFCIFASGVWRVWPIPPPLPPMPSTPCF
jgi:hypothetical protein